MTAATAADRAAGAAGVAIVVIGPADRLRNGPHRARAQLSDLD